MNVHNVVRFNQPHKDRKTCKFSPAHNELSQAMILSYLWKNKSSYILILYSEKLKILSSINIPIRPLPLYIV